jgi:hypothetical protein
MISKIIAFIVIVFILSLAMEQAIKANNKYNKS